MGVLDGIGTFRWRPSAGHWTWDDGLYGLHGYDADDPGRPAPTRALLLGHAHPHDRERLAAALDALAHHHRSSCARLRLVTASGRAREVVVAAGPEAGAEAGAGAGADPALVGYVVALDADSGAPPLTEPTLPGPTDIVIPGPRGRDGTGPAATVAPDESAGDAVVPAVRPSEPGPGVLDGARHAELLRRAHDTLVAGLDLTPQAAASLVAWLANVHEVPPVVVAESLADLERDAAGRPDLDTLLALLGGDPSP